jgi:hypothetical protein
MPETHCPASWARTEGLALVELNCHLPAGHMDGHYDINYDELWSQ